jgi:hypothetical protein
MSKKFTQAYSITPHNTNEIDPRPDAYYVGSGNFTDDHDSWDTPKVHLRGGVFMTAISGNMSEWQHADGSRFSLQPDSMGDVSLVTGTAETNMVNYVHFDSATSFMQIDDHADFNIGTGDFEMMAVVRFQDNGNAYQHIAARDKGGNNWSWLRVSGAAGSDPNKIKFSMSGTDPKSDTTMPLDTWVILGVSRISDDIMLYRNGVDDMSSDLDADDDDDLIIGAIHNGSDHVQSLQGDMAEFIFWEKSLSASDRATYVQRLQDRYFNPQKAKMITCTDPSDGDTYIIKYPQVGQIIHESPTIIRDAGTGASNIVGLKE